MLAREYWVDSFSQFCRSAIEKLTENALEKRMGSMAQDDRDETGGTLFAE